MTESHVHTHVNGGPCQVCGEEMPVSMQAMTDQKMAEFRTAVEVGFCVMSLPRWKRWLIRRPI